jgi:hypothetical protein
MVRKGGFKTRPWKNQKKPLAKNYLKVSGEFFDDKKGKPVTV